MTNNLEKATVAAQCSALLVQDLRALAVTDNLILADVILKEIEIAAAQQIRLERLAANLQHMKEKMAQCGCRITTLDGICVECGREVAA